MAMAGIILVPVAVLCIECVAAVFSPRRDATATSPRPGRPPLAVLIPAHNEERGLPTTLRSVLAQLLPHDRLVVVADNCTDATAAVARRFGAVTIERKDPANRGKGFALDRGVRELEQDPPAVVVMIDADCTLTAGTLSALVHQVVATGMPAQAAYQMDCPPDAGPRACVSALAFIVKNIVRPLGLRRLGLPCLLTGTGMAFPWNTIRDAHLATGNIVEDMQLGIDLSLAGHSPHPCPDARISGTIEDQSGIAFKQRTRWEHGHIQTQLAAVPRLVAAAFARLSPSLFALALEVAVPPVALLVLLLIASMTISGFWAYAGGSSVPLMLLVAGFATLTICTFAAWARFARLSVPFRALVAIPFYVVWKVPLYFAFLFRREKQWVRTFRGGAISVEPAHSASGSCVLRPARP